MSDRPGRRRRSSWPLLFVGLALAIVAGRLLLDARAALRAAEEAMARGDEREAIRRNADAVRLYLPASPYAARGLARLEATADRAERAGDPATARRALEAARGALLGARSFYTPFAERLPAIEGRLAALLAASETPGRGEASPSPERTRWHAERLAAAPGPRIGFALMALLGFGLWLGSAGIFFLRGLDSALRLRRGPATASALGFGVGLALFVIGLLAA